MNSDIGIIYFHGYGSSPETDKVAELRKHFSEVHAFPIDPDPDKSIAYLDDQISNILLATINSEKPLVFVGTSLGAWFAGRLAKMSYAPAVLINPYFSSKAVKVDLGIPPELVAKYDELGFEYPEDTTFFIAPNDEVIDFSNFHPLNVRVIYNSSADHRFNGEPFNEVIELLSNEKF